MENLRISSARFRQNERSRRYVFTKACLYELAYFPWLQAQSTPTMNDETKKKLESRNGMLVVCWRKTRKFSTRKSQPSKFFKSCTYWTISVSGNFRVFHSLSVFVKPHPAPPHLLLYFFGFVCCDFCIICTRAIFLLELLVFCVLAFCATLLDRSRSLSSFVRSKRSSSRARSR